MVDFIPVEDEQMAEFLAHVRRDVGAVVRQERLQPEREWSQQALAARMQALGLNWHQTTVAKVEAGARPVSLVEAVALAYSLGLMDLDDLFGRDGRVGRMLSENWSDIADREHSAFLRRREADLKELEVRDPRAAFIWRAVGDAIFSRPDGLSEADQEARINEARRQAEEEYDRGVDRQT